MNVIAMKDKGFGYYYYSTLAMGISIDTYEEGNELKIKQIYIDDNKFNNVEDVIDYLKDFTKDLQKETLLIYTFNLDLVWYFFNSYIEYNFNDKYLDLFICEDHTHYKVEFRSLDGFVESYDCAVQELGLIEYLYTKAEVAKLYVAQLFKNIFIPEKYVYFSSYQRFKKLIIKAGKEAKVDFTKDFPGWYAYYKLRHLVYRGGLCFNAFPMLRLTENIIHLDRTSAYPAVLLLEKFPMGAWEVVQNNDYKNIDLNNYSYFGCFKLKYRFNVKYKHLLVNYELDIDNDEAELWLTDVDINILSKYLYIDKLECTFLQQCKKDYLPEYFIKYVYEAYIEKVKAKKDGRYPFILAQRKRELNSIYGNLIIDTDSMSEYKNLPKQTRPEWGIWCTAYERRDLVDLASKVEKAVYGDTDSIFCTNSNITTKAVNKYNDTIHKQIKNLCDIYNWDFKLLKDLGSFKVEHLIKDFTAITTKQYGYITEDDEEIVKCSGYISGSIKYHDLTDYAEGKTNRLPERKIKVYTINNKTINIYNVDFIEYDYAIKSIK